MLAESLVQCSAGPLAQNMVVINVAIYIDVLQELDFVQWLIKKVLDISCRYINPEGPRRMYATQVHYKITRLVSVRTLQIRSNKINKLFAHKWLSCNFPGGLSCDLATVRRFGSFRGATFYWNACLTEPAVSVWNKIAACGSQVHFLAAAPQRAPGPWPIAGSPDYVHWMFIKLLPSLFSLQKSDAMVGLELEDASGTHVWHT